VYPPNRRETVRLRLEWCPRRSSTALHSVRASLPTRQTSGKCLPEPADGVCPVPGKGREAERLCPRAGWHGRSTFGPHPTGTQRFATVSSGRSFAQVAGAILRKQVPGQNPDKDESALNSGLSGIGSGSFGPICVVVRVTTAGRKRIVGARGWHRPKGAGHVQPPRQSPLGPLQAPCASLAPGEGLPGQVVSRVPELRHHQRHVHVSTWRRIETVRAGSARHRKPLVLNGHEWSCSVSRDRRSPVIHRYDLARQSSIGQGSNPSALLYSYFQGTLLTSPAHPRVFLRSR
jgi:hypothetical protein